VSSAVKAALGGTKPRKFVWKKGGREKKKLQQLNVHSVGGRKKKKGSEPADNTSLHELGDVRRKKWGWWETRSWAR